jgi:hypothetical protein
MSDVPATWTPPNSVKRYRYSEHDRISIRGIDYCWASTDEFIHTLHRMDQIDLLEKFSHEEIAQFVKTNQIVVVIGWYSAAIRAVVRESILNNFAMGPEEILFGEPVRKRRFHSVDSIWRTTGIHHSRCRL